MTDGQTDRRTDICDCRVAFATENFISFSNSQQERAASVSSSNLGGFEMKKMV